MSEKYVPSKGDRVRVVLEGEVTLVFADGWFDIREDADSGGTVRPDAAHVVSIEKLGPNLPTTPGSVVRVDLKTFALGNDGQWRDHNGANWSRRYLESGDLAVIFDAEETK